MHLTYDKPFCSPFIIDLCTAFLLSLLLCVTYRDLRVVVELHCLAVVWLSSWQGDKEGDEWKTRRFYDAEMNG